MKKVFLLLSVVCLSLSGVSCSSDDNSTEIIDKPGEEKSILVGTWQIESIHFTKFVESGIPANDGCMLEGMRGYDFQEDGTFNFIVGEDSSFDPSAKKYWEWSGDEKGFEIKQLNIAMPPYNFGIKPTNIVFKGEGENLTMSFQAVLANGSEAEFVLQKGTVNQNQASEVTLRGGETFSCELSNQQTSNKRDLLNSTWYLEKGQKVFVQEMNNVNDEVAKEDRAKSILAFSFLNDDKSLFKYTFPMGVISAKEDTWVFNEEKNSFHTTYFTNSFGENDLRFTVMVNKISNNKMEFTFTDDQGTNVKRIFIKNSTFLSTEDELNEFDDFLKEILEEGTTEN